MRKPNRDTASLLRAAPIALLFGMLIMPNSLPDRPATPPFDEVAAKIAAYDCWTSAETMPADMDGVVPGHVLVTHPGQTRPQLHGPSEVGFALDLLFGDDLDPIDGYVVHAFCR